MKTDNKGFTLVELIVVLVILAILAAILVPALLGYIDRAKGQQQLLEAKELMTATQAGIAEAYALEKEEFDKYVTKTAAGVGQKYDFVTSNLFAANQGNGTSADTPAKKIIAKRLLEYVDSKKGTEMQYTFSNKLESGKKASAVIADGQVAFAILYNKKGKILYMQYYRDGKMVTYDGKAMTIENDGTFIKLK